jgi:hypothetical protein
LVVLFEVVVVVGGAFVLAWVKLALVHIHA